MGEKTMRNYLGNIGVVVLIAVGVISLFASAGARRQTDAVNDQCISNVGKASIGITMYAQDYDDVFPIFQNGTELRTAILPYIQKAYRFTCPATHLLYKPNTKLSGQSLTTIKDLGTVWAVRDAKPHADGYSTVGFLDGHVTRGGPEGPEDPNKECVSNAKELTLGLLAYAQDYDEILPIQMKSAWQLEDSIYPYVRSHRLFRCPATGLPYVPNGALSGTPLAQYSDFSVVEVLHDAKPHADGRSTYSYLDGHVVRK
jgi:prepilin-type processing-associated H-X9-DG protein